MGQHAPNTAVMDAQLARNGAHAPFFDVVITQNLRLEIRRECHWGLRETMMNEIYAELGDVTDPIEANLTEVDRKNDSAGDPKGAKRCQTVFPWPSPSPRTVDHRGVKGVNPDASLYSKGRAFGPGNGFDAPHGRHAHDGWLGNADRPPGFCGTGPPAHNLEHSKSGRDHSGDR